MMIYVYGCAYADGNIDYKLGKTDQHLHNRAGQRVAVVCE